MTRSLTAGVLAAVTGEVVYRATAVAMDFPSGMLRLNSLPGDIDIDGETFVGAGMMGSIAVVEETAELASTTLRLGLSGIPRDLIASALGEPYQNRPVTIWEVPLDPSTYQPIPDPIVVFRGRMDVMRVLADGATCSIEVDVTNRLVDWERPRRILFSDEEQSRRSGGLDRSFKYAASMAEKEVAWPSGQYFTKVLYNVK